MRAGTVHMDFCYADYVGHVPATGFEREKRQEYRLRG